MLFTDVKMEVHREIFNTTWLRKILLKEFFPYFTLSSLLRQVIKDSASLHLTSQLVLLDEPLKNW